MSTERLQNVIARSGVASRRNSAEIIKTGGIRVNGKVILEAGHRVTDNDVITLRGKRLKVESQKITIMMNKPRGYICSASNKQGQTVFEIIKDINTRIMHAGRLDKDSEGLLILSNDGNLINMLTHPGYNKEKAYEVTVAGPVSKEQINTLNSRLVIDDYRIQSVKVSIIKTSRSGTIIEFVLKEGRNRQIRNMCRMAGLRINRLVRTRINNFRLGSLKPGKYRVLTDKDIKLLMQ